jgi:IrrE N-terminal-like domain
VDQKIERFFEMELQAAFAEHSIDSVTEAQSLDANALIYRTNDRFVIYVNSDLPRPLKFFTLLHEIGHIATNTLRSLPRSARSDYDERSANVWTLNRIKPYLRAGAFDMYLSAANHSEGLLYERISKFLENDIIGFY